MEETDGQNYALQVAVQTMKERCLQLQQRLALVEDENMQLRMKYNSDYLELSDVSTKSEVEILKEKVAQLTKQKSQLTHNVLMVATENRHLWNRLSKLTQANQMLGSQLFKINDNANTSNSPTKSPASPTSPSNLIRSRTFTQDNPTKIVPRMDKDVYIDTSLEDISLKILNNIAQEKSELEKQCAEMAEFHANNSYIQSSIGFAYLKDDLENYDADFIQHTEKLNFIKDTLLIHRDKLKNNMELFKKLQETGIFCKGCKEKSLNDKNVIEDEKVEEKKVKRQQNDSDEKICPICLTDFTQEQFRVFSRHVEDHFVSTDASYLQNFEVL